MAVTDINSLTYGGDTYNLKDPTKYAKPAGGIPQSDLEQTVQNKLDKSVVISSTQPIETENKLWVDTDAGSGNSYQVPTVAESLAMGISGAKVGDLVRVNSVDSNGKPTSWRKAPLCEITTNPNLLDNWYFVGGGSQLGDGVFPINQRGQSTYVNEAYSIDRWKNVGLPDVTLQNDSIRLTGASSTIWQRLAQPIENAKRLNGKTITLSILYKTSSISARLVLYCANKYTREITLPSSSNAYTVYTLTQSIADGTFSVSDTLYAMIYPQKEPHYNQVINIIAVKLELGSEQTLAHNEGTEQNPVWVLNEVPDYGEELRKCQRYLYRYNCPTTHFSSTDTYLRVPIVHDFASSPSSIVENENMSWYRIDGVQTNINNYTMKINDATPNSFNIQIAPTPAPGSSSSNKVGYISRLNVLVSAEP